MYKRTIDLMDESVFPKESIYIAKENLRVDKSDEDIISAVTSEMINILGVELES